DDEKGAPAHAGPRAGPIDGESGSSGVSRQRVEWSGRQRKRERRWRPMSAAALKSDAILARLSTLHPNKIELGLERISRLLAALGHPERHLPPVIHVAGTNGKGSVCAFTRAMLEAQGLKVHVYTSPHLIWFHERIRLAGKLISEEELQVTLEEC